MADPPVQERPTHHRAKSSVLKSIMITRSHKKLPSVDTIGLAETNNGVNIHSTDSREQLPPSPSPQYMYSPLSEIQQNANRPASPPKKENGHKGLRTPQKMKSSAAVRSLFDSAAREKEHEKKSPQRTHKKENGSPEKPKKSKSSTSLSSIFSKGNKTSKSTSEGPRNKEKENTTPPASAVSEARTPIWAQFSKGGFEDGRITNSSPTRPSEDTSEQSSQPASQDCYNTKYIPGDENVGLMMKQNRPRSTQIPPSTVPLNDSSGARQIDDGLGRARPRSHSRPDSAKRNSRVLAAVAALTGNEKILELNSNRLSQEIQGKDLDNAFEAVLNERNVPENMRAGMRGLTARVKIDFIMNSRQSPPGTVHDKQPKPEENASRRRGRSKAPRSAGSDGSKTDAGTADMQETSAAGSSKHTRSRSKTFTFSKESLSPSKKLKASQETTASQTEPLGVHKSASSKSLASLNSQSNGLTSSGRKQPKAPVPEEYVEYLRKVQKPEIVEVGRLHKLRLLLRNETVNWVNDFIQQGGMTEVIELLRRIMKIEWREEHEDQLLHETLLCLKGLCTTDVALRKLGEIEDSLFPALLKMIFDEEKKGPSEFTTRGIVVNLLCKAAFRSSPQRTEKLKSFVTLDVMLTARQSHI